MSRGVPHLRPELDTAGILSGEPVSGSDWSTLGGLANWCNGHGGMVVPWAACGITIGSGSTVTLPFYIAPKKTAVQRVWAVNVRAGTAGATLTFTDSSSTAHSARVAPTVRTARRNAMVFAEDLSAKTNTAGGATVSLEATGGTLTVESIACYEQTRGVLAASTDDYGVDLTTLRTRQPIADLDYQSVAGVMDAYKNLDARRPCYYQWSVPEANALEFTSGSYVDMYSPLTIPVCGVIPTLNDTKCQVTVCAYAKVDSGKGLVRFTSDQAGGSAVVDVTSTSFAWVTGSVQVDSEDLTTADGRRSAVWEGIQVECSDNTATTLSVAGIAIVRTTTPI